MTELRGFLCNNCGAKSVDQRTGRWLEIRSMMLNSEGWSMIMHSDGLHYCSRACLLEAIPKWKAER